MTENKWIGTAVIPVALILLASIVNSPAPGEGIPVPDGGTTIGLLAAGFCLLAFVRHKLNRRD